VCELAGTHSSTHCRSSSAQQSSSWWHGSCTWWHSGHTGGSKHLKLLSPSLRHTLLSQQKSLPGVHMSFFLTQHFFTSTLTQTYVAA
jgi:hypothetical protein